MNDSKELFDYWHAQVRLKNFDLIGDPQHVPTQNLRHDCTNYDELRHLREVLLLDEEEKSKVIAVIKYQCTARVLQYRAGVLRQKTDQQEKAYQDLEQKQTRLLQLLRILQERLFGKDQELAKLQNRIVGLETENEALRAEAETNKAYAELLQELESLRKQYESEKKRREELARNNQRLGGQVSHAKRNKQKLDEARAALTECQRQLTNLAQDNQRLQHENQLLLAKLEEVQQFLKQNSHESRNHETS
ncbi:MAG: hypothetical protein KME43_20370 [Myxacorys chilensis ATA2-1-KO14]|jgi:DNA repair exonuclease SbcCD ATPase subunit|nr:hypothetical protein [Myxacorys chilensis ATA2-1-KO14]